LRTIKQEFQKTENKIDFNRYRNYELNAHYKELSFRKTEQIQLFYGLQNGPQILEIGFGL